MAKGNFKKDIGNLRKEKMRKFSPESPERRHGLQASALS